MLSFDAIPAVDWEYYGAWMQCMKINRLVNELQEMMHSGVMLHELVEAPTFDQLGDEMHELWWHTVFKEEELQILYFKKLWAWCDKAKQYYINLKVHLETRITQRGPEYTLTFQDRWSGEVVHASDVLPVQDTWTPVDSFWQDCRRLEFPLNEELSIAQSVGGTNAAEDLLFYYQQGVRNFAYSKLSQAKLNQADLPYITLTGSKLQGTALCKAILNSADLSYADLSRANLRQAKLVGTLLKGANLSQCQLVQANLCDSNLRHACLKGAELGQALLVNADLTNADLAGCCLKGADLSGAKLCHACLQKANLTGADLAGADLSGASF